MNPTAPVLCPTCFESFEILTPPPEETPCEVDYDCEICCRPMLVRFDLEIANSSPGVTAQAFSLAD